MKEKLLGELVLGTYANSVRMIGAGILVRLVDVQPSKEAQSRKRIIIADGKNEKNFSIEDFQGFHPAMIEIVAASQEAIEKGINKGDIGIMRPSLLPYLSSNSMNDPRNPVTSEYLDGEVFFRITYNDVESIVPEYRQHIREGKIIKPINK